MTTTGFSSRSAKRVIANPSALPYRSGQGVAWVESELGLNSSGNGRIGQRLLGRSEVMDSILMTRTCLNILLEKRHYGV